MVVFQLGRPSADIKEDKTPAFILISGDRRKREQVSCGYHTRSLPMYLNTHSENHITKSKPVTNQAILITIVRQPWCVGALSASRARA